jgi:hypothetical protein
MAFVIGCYATPNGTLALQAFVLFISIYFIAKYFAFRLCSPKHSILDRVAVIVTSLFISV